MTELEQKAAEAWEHMSRRETVHTRAFGPGPMPAGVALDFVQEVTDDRDAAVEALLWAAGRWLDDRRPEKPDVRNSASFGASSAARGHLLCESFGLALSAVKEVNGINIEVMRDYAQPLNRTVTKEMMQVAARWLKWADDAEHAISLCRAIAAAAHPEGRPQ